MKIYKRTQNLLYTSAETSNARFDLADNFVEIAKRNSDSVGKKDGRLDLTLVYHQFNDEQTVAKAAVTEAGDKLPKDVKFVRVDDDALRGLASVKKLKQQLAKTETDKKNKSWIKTLVKFVLTLVSFVAAVSSIWTFGQNHKQVWGVLLGVAIALGVAFAVLTVLDLIKAVKRKRSTLNELRQTLDVSDAFKWEQDDFEYKPQKVVYVFFYTSEIDARWQAFKKYLQCLPQQASLSCVIFRMCNNPTSDTKYFMDVFNGNREKGYASEKSTFEQLNKNKKAKVFGYALLPLSDDERRELVEELKSANKYVSRGIANGGRDSLYRLVEQDGNIMDATSYFNLVNNVHESIADKSQISVDGVKRILSFLATLNSLLSFLPRNVNIGGGSESDMFLSPKLLQEINSELLESNESALKNTICLIYKDWQNNLTEVAYREYSLLVSEFSADWPLSPYKWAIESFLNYLSYLNVSVRNLYYDLASSEVNFIIEIIKSWHEVNNKSVTAGYFAANYLDIFKEVLQLNVVNGLYCSNYDLLKFVQDTVYAETRATTNGDLLQSVNEFYVSEQVKTAFMQNAVVVPKTFDDDAAKYVGNMSNDCREMHKSYLAERSKLLGLEYTVASVVPAYFELFGCVDNSAEYYSLLQANGEQCVLELYCDLYRRCDEVARQLDYYKYFKISGEASDEIMSAAHGRFKTVEKLSACLFVEGQGELLKHMLTGSTSGEELLSCGMLNCDVFFLLHDLYLYEQGEKKFIFSDGIVSKSYNFIDDFICIEGVNNVDGVNHRFSNMFTDLVNLIADSGSVGFFAKYLLSIVNISGISSSNREIIQQVLLGDAQTQVELDDSMSITNEDVREILKFCYGIRRLFNIDKLKKRCPFITSLPAKGAFAEEADAFVKYAIFTEKVSFKSDSAAIKFIENLKTFSDDFCFAIYNQVSTDNESLLKYSYLVADKLARSQFVRKLLPLILSLDYLDGANKDGVTRTIVDNVDCNVYDDPLLSYYNLFFRNRAGEIDKVKRQGYSKVMENNTYSAITALRHQMSLDLYYHLNKDAGFLFLYAANLLRKMCLLRVKSSQAETVDENKAYSQLNSLSLTFVDNGVKYVSEEYLLVICAIAAGKISNVDDSAKVKIINDLITLLDADDNSVAIDKNVRQKHKQLLTSIRSRI